MEVNYTDEENKKFKNYEIIPEKIENGEELSKLIINNYILTDSNLNEEEKLKLALKYQIQTENTSLFAEVELSEQINDEMKQKIIGDIFIVAWLSKLLMSIFKPHAGSSLRVFFNRSLFLSFRIHI